MKKKTSTCLSVCLSVYLFIFLSIMYLYQIAIAATINNQRSCHVYIQHKFDLVMTFTYILRSPKQIAWYGNRARCYLDLPGKVYIYISPLRVQYAQLTQTHWHTHILTHTHTHSHTRTDTNTHIKRFTHLSVNQLCWKSWLLVTMITTAGYGD